MQLSIYFPKQVAIDNPRLWLVQNITLVTTFVVVLGLLLYTKVTYVREVIPETFIQTWVDLPAADGMYRGDAEYMKDFDSKLEQNYFNYVPDGTSNGWKFENPTYAAPCDKAPGSSCMTDGQAFKVYSSTTIKDRTVGESLFIPTSYVETFYKPGVDGASAGCPFDSDDKSAGSECKHTRSYLIPGVENYKVKFIHRYNVRAPESYFHKMAGVNRNVASKLQVTIREADGEGRIADFQRYDIVESTVSELLVAGGMTDLDTKLEAGDKFPTNTATAASDAAYGLKPAITPRVTGVELAATIDYTGRIFERGPICDIFMKAAPNMVGVTETKYIGDDGSTQSRMYNGVRVRFVRKGTFEWFQFQAMLFSLTTLLVWIRIPFAMVFYFAVYFLGSLSNVYVRFLYQDLNLHNEFNGVSSRLLKRSHGFSDLHDLVEADGTRAISYAQSKRRMQRILEGRRELDEEEREYFTAFFFNNTAKQLGEAAGNNLAISMEDYLKAVSTEESLQYDDIMMFVDTDGTRLGCVEKLFIDGSLKKFVDSQENMKKRQSRAAGGPEGPTPAQTESETAALTEGRASVGESGEEEKGRVSGLGESRSASVSSGGGTRVTKMAEKQSVMFQSRMASNTLTAKLDALQVNLQDILRHKENLTNRNNDYLHYLAHLNEQIREQQKK